MSWLANNWYILIAIGAVLGFIGYKVSVFVRTPSEEQLSKVKSWLLYAVTEAEKKLGGGTGQIKLRYVYDAFLTKFPFLAKIVSFETFSGLVDEALEMFKAMMTHNTKVQEYVEGDSHVSED